MAPLLHMATTLSEAYRDTPLHPTHTTPLDFDSVRDLPDSHSWTETERNNVCPMRDEETSSSCVPIIDLADPNVVELVGGACREWGVFQVTNHGVPSSVVDGVERHTRRLFALPTERKLRALRSPGGATVYGVARISPFFEKLMWHEGFTVMGSAREHARELWPQEHGEFCDAMDNYQKNMKSLAYKILVLILKYLEAKDEDQEKLLRASSMHESEGVIQLNSYPPCPNPNRAIGLPPHTDSLLLTIIHQNDTKGLQIFHDNNGWISVPPVSGALIVNTGDLLHIVSNARFPTMFHRVVPNETSQRLTVAYFHSPRGDSIIAPLSHLADRRYRSTTVKEYVHLKNKHLEKALSLLRIV